MLELKYHAKCRKKERKIPWATIRGAILQGYCVKYPDGVKVYRWLGVKVVVAEDGQIITVYDAIKNG